MTATDTNTKPSASPGWLLIVCASGLVFYALSPLLVIFLFEQFSAPSWDIFNVVDVVYAPLIFLSEHVPLVQAFYEWLLKPLDQP